jgi:hypothetical protein
MLKRVIWAGLLIAIGIPGVRAAVEVQDDLAALVETEREFSRTSVGKGIKQSFLEFMSDGAILFRPHPVNGKEWMQSQPAPTAQLSWYPVFADISAAGDLGYTTGPFELRRSASEQPIRYGNFMTIWRKEPDGK